MKIIFSRKGFDSTAGGFPSLIFPNGTLFSIPIPSSKDKHLYQDLKFHYEGESIQSILNDLTGKSICSKKRKQCDYSDDKQFCHYDPMPFAELEFEGIALGQVKGAEGHLRNQGVGEGDVFLFYGWFKSVIKKNGVWEYAETPDIHLIWSYMRIGESICLDTDEQQEEALKKHPFLHPHPHIGKQRNMKNCIYLSDNYKYFSYGEERCLTDVKNFRGRATWRLPNFFHQPEAFSFLKNFTLDQNDVVISYRGYGQEFVLNLDKVNLESDKEFIMSYIKEIIG